MTQQTEYRVTPYLKAEADKKTRILRLMLKDRGNQMTRQTQIDNVLVNREKLKKLIVAVEYMSTCEQLRGSNQGQYKAILAMPDVIESERDIEVVAMSMAKAHYHLHGLETLMPVDDVIYAEGQWKYGERPVMAQAAINALAYKGVNNHG